MLQWSVPAAMRAVRATVVIAGLFALSHEVAHNLQMATYAAFGGFAALVLVTFAGSRREKLAAHASLAVAGSVLLTIGTAADSSAWLAALVTLFVAFAVFFGGVAGPNAAAGVTAALLAYVLPAASPGTLSTVPDRLAGWWMASVAATAAVLLLSPRPGGGGLRAAGSKLARELADAIAEALRAPPARDRADASIAAEHELLAQFTATPYSPTGLTVTDQALADLVEVLEWCTALVADMVREGGDLRQAWPEDRELLEASVAVLEDVASSLDGGRPVPRLDRLQRSLGQCRARLGERVGAAPGANERVRLAFHAHAIAVAVRAGGGDALMISRMEDPEAVGERRRGWYGGEAALPRARRRVHSLASVIARDASLRSVWFVNSVCGAVALAAAVAVADVLSVQHGFWVVLGTLSVLRTNAASTGSTALRALGGTVLGFAIGAALLVEIGTASAALWVALPIAVFVAAYAPGTAPFAVGQAAFTITVAVLFNLLVPVGWEVGVVRIEDVALGCAVSVVAGGLFWPHGVSSVVGDDLADALRAGAAYLRQAVDWACGARTRRPDGGMAAITAALRLDDALRGFLAEQGTKHIAKDELWRLVGGSLRLRLTAHAIAGLPADSAGDLSDRGSIRRRAGTLSDWYEELAELVGRPRGRAVASIDVPGPSEREPVSNTHYAVWLSQHLDHLHEHMAELVGPAIRVAEIRRRPWWR